MSAMIKLVIVLPLFFLCVSLFFHFLLMLLGLWPYLIVAALVAAGIGAGHGYSKAGAEGATQAALRGAWLPFALCFTGAAWLARVAFGFVMGLLGGIR